MPEGKVAFIKSDWVDTLGLEKVRGLQSKRGTMNTSTDFSRPPDHLVDAFEGVPSSIAGDAMGRRRCTSAELEATSPPTAPVAGPVLTVETPPGSNYAVHKALELIEAGAVLVVDAGGSGERAVWGELMSRYSVANDLAAVVIDGAIRDSRDHEDIDLPVYSVGATPTGPIKQRDGQIGQAVSCDGVAVSAGDIAVCDQDGVAFVPLDDAEEVLHECRSYIDRESEWMDAVNDEDVTTLEIIGFHNE
jgi:4-hydroxy-4-methyl-2-oxoglutarate aldolase